MNYIIITPAKNEEQFIEKTILSVINQTILPLKWIIVDDGSTDSTADIVKKYLTDYPFITLVQREKNISRNFGNKVYAIRRGFEEVKNIDYDYYCNLDADVSFESNYFEFLLNKFYENPKLGICGGKVYDLIFGRFIPQKYENHSVAGPVQFFRKECYEGIGGYPFSKIGFIDGYAEISARMNHWQTLTFNEIIVKHYRPVGTLRGSNLKHCFEGGKMEYLFGYSFFYHLVRNAPRIFNSPFLLCYIATLAGYFISFVKKENRPISDEFKRFVRKEQKDRISSKFKNLFFTKKI